MHTMVLLKHDGFNATEVSFFLKVLADVYMNGRLLA